MPADAATSTCAIVTPATALTSSWPTARSGGTQRSTGIITKAPPAPSSPATNAPAHPSPSNATPNAGGRGGAAIVRRGVGLDGRRGGLLRAEVGRYVVHAELQAHLRVGLHLGRRPLAGRIVLDRFLEVPRGHAREDRHGVRLALAGEAVARAADECLGSARAVERSGRGGAGEPEHEEEADKEDRPHVVLSRRPSRAWLARGCWPTRPPSAPTSRTGR